jgi:uncharacterized protein
MKFYRINPFVRFSAWLLFAFLFTGVNGQQIPEPMSPPRLVNDFTSLLAEQQQITLSNKLLDFNNQTSTQIYVVTWDDLQGYPINEYGVLLAEKWGIGQKGKDNGLLILVSPANRKVTIQTGYGLEGAVPDAIAKRLIENVINPAFRQGEYYAGLDSATNVLMSLTRGEFTADDYLKGKNDGAIPVIVIIIFIILLFIFSGINKTRKRFYSPTRSIPWWLLMGAGNSSNTGWGSFSSGRGGFGGFGGGGGGGFGGFGGGGGGSFGGGGASGGW